MDFFNYKTGELYCEDVPAEKIARDVGTPVFVYSKATLLHHYRQIADAFAPVNATVCYSIKSCGNLNILKLHRLFAPNHNANVAFIHAQAGFGHVLLPSAIASPQFEPGPVIIEEQERTHFRFH